MRVATLLTHKPRQFAITGQAYVILAPEAQKESLVFMNLVKARRASGRRRGDTNTEFKYNYKGKCIKNVIVFITYFCEYAGYEI